MIMKSVKDSSGRTDVVSSDKWKHTILKAKARRGKLMLDVEKKEVITKE